jgi:hypothetical protein
VTFLSALEAWQWAILAAVPAAIVLLYFLKLRRRPLVVPSTYLWSRTLEDLHVNSIWQRLRRNLLLFLQLLLLALIALALLRPGWRGTEVVGSRFIFLVDVSASMQATDVGDSRLEAAKKQVETVLSNLPPDHSVMLLTSSNVSRVELPYSNNAKLLRQRLATLTATNRGSDIEEALRYAEGLANPGRSAASEQDVPTAQPMPATLYIFSDGGYSSVPSFFLGHLEPVYVPIGSEAAQNVGILAFSAERNVENPEQTQAYARLENFSDQTVSVEVSLLFNGRLLDVDSLTIEPGSPAGVDFNLRDVNDGVLTLTIDTEDDFALDNTAYAVLNPPRKARLLLATPGNDALQFGLTTTESQKIADLSLVAPDYLQSEEFGKRSENGEFDLVICDRCAPPTLPAANTLFIGHMPPGTEWQQGPMQRNPLIEDTDRVHPLTHLVEMSTVRIAEGFTVTPPPGGRSLMDARGALMAIAPRESFEDVVMGFDIFSIVDGQVHVNTNWPLRRSFPVFLMNVVRYLGGGRSLLSTPVITPGQAVMLQPQTAVDRLRVIGPDGQRTTLAREVSGEFVFTLTDQLGVYEVFDGEAQQPGQRFAVNLFQRRESDIRPEPAIKLEHVTITGETTALEATRSETWKWLLLLGLVVLLIEWYIYNRRVYL